MKLWRIWQTENQGYDTYDCAVVAAETEWKACCTYPGGYTPKGWPNKDDGAWAPAGHISALCIGEATDSTQPGVVCASFNAG